jgi:NADH:ubiquinone oxidoreductase subunit 6 (subunit J)
MFNLFILTYIILFFCYFVIISTNPINSLLSLIACFALISFLLCCFELTFFAFIFITIYIGAIAIFFLFIIMFINIKKEKINYSFTLPLLIVIFFSILKKKIFFFNTIIINFNILYLINYKKSLEILAFFLYYYFFFFSIFAGILLFITMLGAIYLLQTE